jgi:histidyl-tRNA synthetase
MKIADKIGARYVYIIGEDEINKKSGILKEMKTSEQKAVAFGSLVEVMKGVVK